MRKILIVFLLIINTLLCGQTNYLKVILNNNEFYISAVERNQVNYFSVKDFAQLLDLNFSYDTKSKKIKIENDNSEIIITAKNSFVIISEGKEIKNKFQIPVSTLLLNNEVFFPVIFCSEILSEFLNSKVKYAAEENQLIINFEKKMVSHIEKQEDKAADSSNIRKAVQRYDIEKIEIDEKANGTLLRLKCSKEVKNFKSSIQKNKLFLFLSNVTISPEITSKFHDNNQIKKIEAKNFGENVQIEFTFDESTQFSDSLQDAIKDFDSNDIIITLFKKQSFPNKIDSKIQDWILDTVVIDPGHGGKDAGAIGITGVKEKDINLKIALKLGELIKKNMPEIKVVYTRTTDKFVELYKRGKIANENNGKLFISIHCNSVGKRKSDSRGSEVYLLRPGKTKRAIEIAEFENSVIKYEDDPSRYKELTDENFILVSMAQSSFMRYSEKFAEILHTGWDKYVKIPSRGVKQAGFYVLVGASMPSVLIETGFISNKIDESYLKSNKGQLNIANSIFQSIKKYKLFYDNELKNK